MSVRLKFDIVEISSEDAEYPASELLSHNVNTKGWQSVKQGQYPQYLILKFNTPVRIRQIQFLSHQSKISSKVELYTYFPDDGIVRNTFQHNEFKRLGYLSLDTNSRSSYEAREFKSVYVNIVASFLKVVLNECHRNKFNAFNQVGLIAINVLGEQLQVTQEMPSNSAIMQQSGGEQKISEEFEKMQIDPKTKLELSRLTEQKKAAVENEDYEEAKRLKLQIDRFKLVISQIQELEREKQHAVEDEDYDTAKKVKIQIDRLRNEALMDNKLADNNEYNSNNSRQNQNQNQGYQPQYNQPSYHQEQPIRSNSNQPRALPKKPSPYRDEEELMHESTHNVEQYHSMNNINNYSQDPIEEQDQMPAHDLRQQHSNSHNVHHGIMNKDDRNHEEKVVGGKGNFFELLNQELQKEGADPMDEPEVEAQPKPKPIKQFLKKGKRENELKVKEVENRQKKLIEHDYIEEINESMRIEEKPKKKTTASPAKNTKKQTNDQYSNPHTYEEEGVVDLGESYAENVCYFCGKGDLRAGLDEHFYKECPMLKSCFYCKQIVEVSSLSEHYMSECEKNFLFQKCDMCELAVLKSNLDSHSRKCKGLDAAVTKCLVCLKKLDDNDLGWKNHLLTSNCRYEEDKIVNF